MARKIINTVDPAVGWAEKLWDQLRTGLLDVEKTIAQIIHDKAWEPLGYNDFTSAWAARLSDITLAVEVRPHVVYQMYREGSTPEDVAMAVKGVGLETANAYQREMNNGVPAKNASGRTPRPRAEVPFRTVFVQVPTADHRAWTRIAKRNNTTLAAIGLEAMAVAVGELP